MEVLNMAKCDICGKGVTFGLNVSHSNRKTNRTWKPNVRKVRVVTDNGTHKSAYVLHKLPAFGKATRA